MSIRSPAFGVRAQTLERAHVVSPTGDLDLHTIEEVRAALAGRAESCEVVVLDLRELTFCDTSGLRLVVETLQGLRPTGTRFALVRGCADVQRLFALARMDDRLPFFDDLDGALAA